MLKCPKCQKFNIFFYLILILILCSFGLSAEESQYKWKKISGKWQNQKGENNYFLVETKAKTIQWGYSELINYNSIITLSSFTDYSKIEFSINVKNPIVSPVEIMTFFRAKNYRDFYAFKFIGDDRQITKILFLRSSLKDNTKPHTVKWNFLITELFNKNYRLKYNEDYRVEIKVKENRAVLSIDGENICEINATDNLNIGRMGFSNKNAHLRISDLRVFIDETVIFEDDFSKDSIKRKTVKGSLKKI